MKKNLGALTCALLLCPYIVTAGTYEWQGTSSCDLFVTNNWSCGCHPGAGDTEQFNSNYPSVCIMPEADDGYPISTFDFPNNANFTFNIATNGNPLTFNGPGSITGATNPTINLNNIDNSNTISGQLTLANASNSLGSGTWNIINSATLDSGSSQNLGYINGYQLLSSIGSLDVLSGAQIIISNTGTNNSPGDNNTVGYISNYQWYTGPTTVGDHVAITISNAGYDYTQGGNGGNYVGNTSTNLSTGDSIFGDFVTITLSNYGFVGAGSNVPGSNYETIAYMGSPQADFYGTLRTGDHFTLTTSNYGEDQGDTGGNYVAANFGDGCVYFGQGATFGDHATISHTNKGVANSTYSNTADEIGLVYSQIYTNGSTTIQAGDYFSMTATNIGHDSSHSAGGNYVGSVDDNDQITFNSALNVGDHAAITVSNSGLSTGSATSNANYVGYVLGQLSVASIDAGKNMTITVENNGTNTSSNPDSWVGYVNGNQFYTGPFKALENLTIKATNTPTGTGNFTGVITSSQINFSDTCTLNDGTFISAINNGPGTVGEPQIWFQQGFNLTGKATFQALNSLTGSIFQGQGIHVGDGPGGDVHIILGNSMLYVPSAFTPSFTIGALEGDVNSFVQCNPPLFIDTDAGVNTTFSGTIINFGMGVSSLTKTGPGTQVLSDTSNNTFTGLTTVEEGTLVLNGSLLSDVSVTTQGTLAGNGTVYGHLTNTGTISPGQSIGTLHFASGFDNFGGDYDVEVTGTPASDLIDVTGTANVEGGLVYVRSADGTYAFNHRYTIVSATDVVGDYDKAVSLNPLIVPILSKDAQHIYLDLITDIAAGAKTCNQQLIASQLDSINSTNPDLNRLLSLIVNLPLNEVPFALDELVGYQHGSDLFTTVAINRQFIRRLYDPIRFLVTNEPNCCSPCGNFASAWVEGGGVFTEVNGRKGARGFHTTGYEVTAGVQTTFSRDWTVGVAGSYEHDHLNFKHGAGHGNHNTWFAGLYGLYRPSCFYALADFAYGHSSNTLDRRLFIGIAEYRAHSKPDINEYTFYGEGGYDFCVCNVLVQPFVGIEAGSFQRNRVLESYASGVELDIKNRGISLAVSRLGFHFTAHNYGLDLSFDVAWNYRFSQTSNTFTERFVEFGSNFDLCHGHDLDRNSVDYALTLTSCLDCNWNFYIEGLGESWTHSHIYSIQGGVQFFW